MIQTFGILGFLLGLLAMFFASEVMRRASHRASELEMALFKANLRLQKVESQMAHIDRLATEVRYEKKRQAETISAMAKKGEIRTSPATDKAEKDRFTPSHYKTKNTG